MLVHGLLATLLDLDHLIDELHRARTIKRQQVDDVVDLLDLILAAGLDHAARLELEHAHRLAAVQQIKGRLIIQWHILDAEIRLHLTDVFDRFLDDREVAQTEEIHFQQTHFGDRAHVVLGHHLALVASRERHMVIQGTVANHDARSVNANIPVESLERQRVGPRILVSRRCLDGLTQLGIALPLARQNRIAERFLLVLIERFGVDHFRQAITLGVCQAHHARDISNHALGAHRAVGDDVRNTALAVLFAHIINHLRPARLAEIDINIRRAHTLGIEEALEQQTKLERANVGDPQGISHQRSRRRSTTRPHRNVLLPCPADEVRRDQEVGCETKLVNDLRLVLEPPENLRVGSLFRTIARNQSLGAKPHQILLARTAVRRAELRVLFR